MSSNHSNAKCDCCGTDIRQGEGYVLNASLSEKFAKKIHQTETEKGTQNRLGARLVEFRMKQVLACSEACARRAVDSAEEIELARRAALLWWQTRSDATDAAASEDVFITKAMLSQAARDIQGEAEREIVGGASEQPAPRPATDAEVRCQFLFALGGGFDPATDSRELAEEYIQDHPKIDFSDVEIHSGSIGVWDESNTTQLRDSVLSYLRDWFQTRDIPFDSKRLLYSDFYDDEEQKSFVVVAIASPRIEEENSASPIPTIEQPILTIEQTPPPSGSTSLAQTAKNWSARLPRPIILFNAACTVAVLITGLILFWPPGQAGTSDTSNSGTGSRGNGKGATGIDPAAVPVPDQKVGVCRVYTSEPGFLVLVDADPARTADGNLLRTPCAVTVSAGNQTITVVKKGFQDESKVVAVTQDSEVIFETSPDPFGSGSRILDAPYFNAAVGQPIALDSLNSTGKESDPYVTPDGLSIWFAADRREGRGIYYATRPTVYDKFDPPSLVRLTRGSDMLAAPSITGDSLFIVYAVPEKQRLIALTRENPLADFDGKDVLRSVFRSSPVWQSAQILSDGLRVYWVEEDKGDVRTFASMRSSPQEKFKKTLKVDMPGIHPCLSHDGLRQYVFDGKTLRRARRGGVRSKFSDLESLAELNLDNYVDSSKHRQFFVSDDEQWLFYSDDPNEGGDLYMARISEGRRWGMRPRGKKIPPLPVRVAKVPAKSPKSDPKKKKKSPKQVDPRLLPLPYTTHWQQFTSMLAARKYAAARQLVTKGLSNPTLAQDRESLNWDREDAGRVNAFWKDIATAAGKLKPGDTYRIGSAKLEFVRFENGALIGKAKTKDVSKPVSEMSIVDLTALFDRFFAEKDADAQLRIGTFLFYDSNGKSKTAIVRFGKSADGGTQFIERQGRRLLKQAQAEFDREKLAEGVGFINQVLAFAPKSNAAQQAVELREELYTFIKWRQVGGRKWAVSGSEYSANAARAPRALLLSPKEYGNFELSMEWATTAATGQGGIFFRYSGQGEPYASSFKIHLSNEYAGDAQSCGSLFGITAPRTNAPKPAGQWNTLVLRVEGEKVVVTMNGRRILEATASNPDIGPKGYIALDGIVGGIRYRKILLSELPDK